MQRLAITGPLSPKLLKHFAAATVLLTILIAIFASGEDWGAQAQIDEAEAKNQLVATGAEKLGTQRVATKLKINSAPAASSFGNDAGEFGTNDGGYGTPTRRRGSPDTFHPVILASTAANPGGPGNPTSNPGGDPAGAGPGASPAPSTQDIANLTASSARRSSHAESGD
jgi:hypothetical protein